MSLHTRISIDAILTQDAPHQPFFPSRGRCLIIFILRRARYDFLNRAGNPVPPGCLWENCKTTDDNLGYNAMDKRFKTGREIVHILVKTVARDGNLLLNVGPVPSGKIDSILTESLNEAGAWLKVIGESIYSAGPFRPGYKDSTLTTAKDDKVYLHLLD